MAFREMSPLKTPALGLFFLHRGEEGEEKRVQGFLSFRFLQRNSPSQHFCLWRKHLWLWPRSLGKPPCLGGCCVPNALISWLASLKDYLPPRKGQHFPCFHV